jgi:hypothetical protein
VIEFHAEMHMEIVLLHTNATLVPLGNTRCAVPSQKKYVLSPKRLETVKRSSPNGSLILPQTNVNLSTIRDAEETTINLTLKQSVYLCALVCNQSIKQNFIYFIIIIILFFLWQR